jgi:hypothetical protein
LLEQLVGRTRLSWFQLSAAVGGVLLALLGGAAYLNGVLVSAATGNDALSHLYDSAFWNMVWNTVWQETDKPILTVYILSLLPTLRRVHNSAIESLRSVVVMDDDAFDRTVAEVSIHGLCREWVAAGVGAAAGLLLLSPWSGPDFHFWPIKLYLLLSTTLLHGLVGWFIYVSLSDSRLFTKLLSHSLDIDVFDLTPLQPIARWSLGISLSIIGGVTLATGLNPSVEEFLSVHTLISNSAMILVAIVVFFLGMMSTHRVIVAAKEQKLGLVRHTLSAMFQELQEQGTAGQVQTWLAYEKRIQDAPEWPFTAAIIRNLLISTLLPGAAFICRMLLLEAASRMLFLP